MKKNKKMIFWMVLLFICSFVHGDQKPNIIFFIADDMLPSHFNCLSAENSTYLTPNLDRLAREGMLLLGQQVVSPVCTPSRYSVLTGLYPSRAKNKQFVNRTIKEGQSVVQFNTEILDSDQTIGKILQRAGYTTGFVGKNHVVHVDGIKKFTNYNADPKNNEIKAQLISNHQKVCQAIRATGFNYVDRIYHSNAPWIGLKETGVHNLDWITDGSVEFIRNNAHKPFFLYFASTISHGPTQSKKSWNANPRMTPVGYLDSIPRVQLSRETLPKRLKEVGLRANDSRCNILWMDDALGALLRTLEEQEILDHTWIFFFNDHGQIAKGTLYQGGICNPSIIWKKGGFSAENVCSELISNIDFVPTILDIANIKYEKDNFDGDSFFPIFSGEELKERVFYYELGYARAIRVGDWKYIAIRYPDLIRNMTFDERKNILVNYNQKRKRTNSSIVTEDPMQEFSHFNAIPGGGSAEIASTGKNKNYYDADQLYYLKVDPKEEVNLASQQRYSYKLTEMKKTLQKVLDTLPSNFPL